MKLKQFSFFLMTLAMVFVGFTSCSDDDDNDKNSNVSLVGLWKQVSETATNNETGESETSDNDAYGFLFNEDGSGVEYHYYSETSSPISWYTSDGTLVIIDAEDDNAKTYPYGISGSQLWMEFEENGYTYRMFFDKQ